MRAALATRIFIASERKAAPLREKEEREEKKVELVLSNSPDYDGCTCNRLLRKGRSERDSTRRSLRHAAITEILSSEQVLRN